MPRKRSVAEIVEDARVRDGQHTFARLECELLDQAFRDGGVVERQSRLRQERGRERERNDDARDTSHALLRTACDGS